MIHYLWEGTHNQKFLNFETILNRFLVQFYPRFTGPICFPPKFFYTFTICALPLGLSLRITCHNLLSRAEAFVIRLLHSYPIKACYTALSMIHVVLDNSQSRDSCISTYIRRLEQSNRLKSQWAQTAHARRSISVHPCRPWSVLACNYASCQLIRELMCRCA